MTLGDVMMVAGAFVKVQTALGWLSDNAINIADFFGSARRAGHLDLLFRATDEGTVETNVSIIESEDDRIVIENLCLSTADGQYLFEDAQVVVEPGDRVLIKGESGSGKSTLLRAIAGLWPWGSGIVRLPRDANVTFMPQKPYLPLGTLRNALLYTNSSETLTSERLNDVIVRCGLEHLVHRLDAEENWQQTLSGGEQQRIGFARAILSAPDILILDEPTSALDETTQMRIMELLRDEVPRATVLHVAHRVGLDAFHNREIQILRSEASPNTVAVRSIPLWRRALAIIQRLS